MKRFNLFVLLGILCVIFFSFFIKNFFLPLDIFNTFPSFNQGVWERPKNSLIADPISQFEPWRIFAKKSFLKGEFPVWNNLNGGGAPFFANPQTAVLYPLNLFYYILPSVSALFIIPILKLVLCFLFLFLYFKIIHCSRITSFIGAFVGTFSAFPIVWLLWPQTNVFILFPLLLYLTERIYQSKLLNHKIFILVSITYFIAILGGHPETLFHILLIHWIYIVLKFWKRKEIYISFLFWIGAGFILGSIQIFPFIEYLSYSYVIHQRLVKAISFSLPLESSVLNFIPFLFGAPHTEFYKPFINGTNFQETISGYVGPAISLLGIISIFKVKIDEDKRIWLTILGISFLLAYAVWPISFILNFTPLKTVANNRLVGFGGTGIVVLATLFLQDFYRGSVKKNNLKFFFKFILVLLLLTIIFILFVSTYKGNFSESIIKFYPILLNHVLLILVSTFIFFLVLHFLMINKISNKYFFLFLVPLFFQSIFLFWNYNYFTAPSLYYPQTKLTKTLNVLPEGRILEIGNPNFSENINIAYGLSHAENYDALEINDYKKEFDQMFPIKNQWGKVDEASYDNLIAFGIDYIVSDYDVRLIKQNIQIKSEKILSKIIRDHPVTVYFTPEFANLKQIRFLTANFNRKNSCVLLFKIFHAESNNLISEQIVPCGKIHDFMFYTVTLKKTLLIPGEKYQLKVMSNESSDNAISLWGNREEIPYLKLLYENDDSSNNLYDFIYAEDNLSLLKVKNVASAVKSREIIQSTPQKILYKVTMSQTGDFVTYKTAYPGWFVKVDGRIAAFKNVNSFISVSLSKGTHSVELIYFPISFYGGLVISLFSLLTLAVYFFHEEKNMEWRKRVVRKWHLFAKKGGKISAEKHAIIILISIFFATSLFLLILKVLPVNFSVPETTAINWLTVNHYAKQQDYFYFYSGFFFVFIITVLFWFFYIWKKEK